MEENNKYYNAAPCLIVEVLSDATARIDQVEKLNAYRMLPSLQEYARFAGFSGHRGISPQSGLETGALFRGRWSRWNPLGWSWC
ncbi:MAG: Uma2 family endonuclease [Thiolinea sp.]